jgi:transposase
LRFLARWFIFGVMNVTDTERITLNGIVLGPELTEAQARVILALGPEAVIYALLTQAKMLAEQDGPPGSAQHSDDPSCPSGQKPPYEKSGPKGRKKKPGRKQGHAGSCRQRPDRVDRSQEHRAVNCPDCGHRLKRCQGMRHRYIEDIPEGVRVEVTRHLIHRDWCPACRKMVEPVVPEALSNATIGNRLLVMSAWLHFALGNTISQILSVFNFHLQFNVTPGGLVQMWHRLAELLESWYQEIAEEVVHAGVLHADETSWRVNGRTHWLWCFTNHASTLFTIERSRAGPVVLKFITDCFDGVLVSDFWGAYNVLTCAKQKCLVHLLRDLERVEKYKDIDADWIRFAKKLRRLIRDAIRLRKRMDTLDKAAYESRYHRIEKRLQLLIDTQWTNQQARRLIKRLRRHQHELFMFLLERDVPFENNFAERTIRQAVIMRKNSYNNRSDRGAVTQATLMSVLTTLKQRNLNPVKTLEQALRIYIRTGQLPTLAEFSTARG